MLWVSSSNSSILYLQSSCFHNNCDWDPVGTCCCSRKSEMVPSPKAWSQRHTLGKCCCVCSTNLWVDKRCADLHRDQGVQFSLVLTNFAIWATNDRFHQTWAAWLKWPRWLWAPRIINVLRHLHVEPSRADRSLADCAGVSWESPGLNQPSKVFTQDKTNSL